jgi:putative ABC transport system permease protein
MDIGPILSTLRRHKIAASLIVLEIALTCAIVCNALFLIGHRIERMGATTGMADTELLHLRVSNTQRVDNADALTQQDLATLRGLPGVKGAAVVNQMPFGNNSSETSIGLVPDQRTPTLSAALYLGGETAVATLGLRLVEGRDFLPEEYQLQSNVENDPQIQLPAVMLSRLTAERLFPGVSAVGKDIYIFGSAPTRVVGVLEKLGATHPGDEGPEYGLMLPVRPAYNRGSYMLRVDSSAPRAEMLRRAADALAALDSRRIISDRAVFEDMRAKYYQQDRWMAVLLGAMCAALLVVTAFGIVGLASFWVQQRTRMIGVRRALGATRGQILRYFQTENLLLTTLGIVLGMAAAYGINHWLMLQYALPRLPAHYLPVGAVALWLLGQLAVLGPARRAAALPPVVVMRLS